MHNVSKPHGYFLCVDPGVIGTGWAVFNSSRGMVPLKSGVIRPKKYGVTREARIHGICHDLRALISIMGIQTMLVEEPGLFAAHGVSYAAAVKGDLFTLSFLVGAMLYVGLESKCTVHLVSPAQWKGQMDKDVVRRRIERAYGAKVSYRDHEMDAVGMGLSALGML